MPQSAKNDLQQVVSTSIRWPLAASRVATCQVNCSAPPLRCAPNQGITIASDFVILCLSQESVEKEGYLQKEFRLALNKYAEKPPGKIFLIPLKFNECQIPDLQLPDLGVNLRDIQWLNYREADGFENLIRAIKYQLKT